MVLESLGKSLNQALRRLVGASVVDEEVVKEVVRDIQRALLQADVNVELVLKLSETIEKRALQEDLPPGIPRREHVIKVLYDALASFLGGEEGKAFSGGKGRPNVIMLVGIQGSGKTTTTGKIAKYHQKRGIRTALVCADTYRLGAYDQLKQLSEQLNIDFYGEPDSKDAVKTAKKGLKQFLGGKYDLILVDTAGRHKNEKSLIKEMKELAKGVKPNEIVLVIDGTLGQQAAAQSKAFQTATPLGSIIVTKLDGTAKGGGALSAVAATGVPIRFIGTGERMDDLEVFRPTRFVGRILGMGDLQSLVEKVRDAQVTPSKDTLMKFMMGKFTLDDFYDQMISLRKMGPLKKVFSMLGLAYKLPEEMQDMAEEQLDHFKVIIQSMTKDERQDPKIVNASRARRIGRGSGTTQKEVRLLIKQYDTTKKTMKRFRKLRGGRGAIPGIPGAMGAINKHGKMRRR